MKLVIGSDHAGFQLKAAIGDLLRSLGHDVLDVGAFNENPSDYPDFAEAVGRAVLDRKAERGVLICGSGVGASVAANRAGFAGDRCEAGRRPGEGLSWREVHQRGAARAAAWKSESAGSKVCGRIKIVRKTVDI